MWTKNSQPMGKMSENFRGIFLTHTVVDGQQCCRESVGQTFALVLLSCRQVAYLEIWKERPRSAFHVYIFKSIQILALFVFILKISTKMGGGRHSGPLSTPPDVAGLSDCNPNYAGLATDWHVVYHAGHVQIICYLHHRLAAMLMAGQVVSAWSAWQNAHFTERMIQLADLLMLWSPDKRRVQ